MDSSGAGLGRRTSFCEGGDPPFGSTRAENFLTRCMNTNFRFRYWVGGGGGREGRREQVKFTEMCYHAAWTLITQLVLLFILRLLIFFLREVAQTGEGCNAELWNAGNGYRSWEH